MVIVAGGVSANKYLRERFMKEITCPIKFPAPELTTDNAIMIGIAGFVSISINPAMLHGQTDIKADGNLTLNS